MNIAIKIKGKDPARFENVSETILWLSRGRAGEYEETMVFQAQVSDASSMSWRLSFKDYRGIPEAHPGYDLIRRLSYAEPFPQNVDFFLDWKKFSREKKYGSLNALLTDSSTIIN